MSALEILLIVIISILLALIIYAFAIKKSGKNDSGLNSKLEYFEKLQKVTNLTQEEAKQILFQELEKDLSEDMESLQVKYLNNFQERVNQIAKEITAIAVQRCSSEVANEFTVTTIKIDDEEIKGKLIGKNGRNIQWLEKTLGVELIIDDTPKAITISGFSSIRRAVAKKTIENLLIDGRIHPSLIEEMYEKAQTEIAEETTKLGQSAVEELGIYDFPIKLVKLIGRLNFRSGYGQNILKHSIEMAKLAGLLADGLNAEFPTIKNIDKMICIKGALLHDIGKSIDEEMTPKGNHIEVGEKICDMFDLNWKIKKCISSHHTTGGDKQSYTDNETGEVCLEAAIVDACDTLSGARPGARKESVESYLQRLEAIENIANKVEGVEKSWIMRGAKELWVFFDITKVDTDQMHKKVKELANEINTTVNTPQEIKIIGLREDKIVAYTR